MALKLPARKPQAQGCHPEPSARCPQPPRAGRREESRRKPVSCMYNMERRAPMRCGAKRAIKSAPPQVSAVRSPSKIPMRYSAIKVCPQTNDESYSCSRSFRSEINDLPSELILLLSCGHAALQLFKPVEHDVDLRRRGGLLLVGLEHQEALTVR